MKCELCPRRCGVDRRIERGFCGCGAQFTVARAALHRWEEPCFTGDAGAGAVFFGGCTMRCVFCQNFEISRRPVGETLDDDALIGVFKRLEASGAACIDLVSPTPYTDGLARVLRRYKPAVPVVWNSNGYERAESLNMLEGLCDVYLPDVKYYDDACARAYSGTDAYFEAAFEAVTEMVRQTGAARFDDSGRLVRGVLIRHLVLPGNTRQSLKILERVARDFPGVPVSLMSQYFPTAQAAAHPPLNRRLKHGEYARVVRYAQSLGLSGYRQSLSSASARFVPDFGAFCAPSDDGDGDGGQD